MNFKDFLEGLFGQKQQPQPSVGSSPSLQPSAAAAPTHYQAANNGSLNLPTGQPQPDFELYAKTTDPMHAWAEDDNANHPTHFDLRAPQLPDHQTNVPRFGNRNSYVTTTPAVVNSTTLQDLVRQHMT